MHPDAFNVVNAAFAFLQIMQPLHVVKGNLTDRFRELRKDSVTYDNIQVRSKRDRNLKYVFKLSVCLEKELVSVLGLASTRIRIFLKLHLSYPYEKIFAST